MHYRKVHLYPFFTQHIVCNKTESNAKGKRLHFTNFWLNLEYYDTFHLFVVSKVNIFKSLKPIVKLVLELRVGVDLLASLDGELTFIILSGDFILIIRHDLWVRYL